MKPEIFRAYDIRGRYPSALDEQDVQEIARVLAKKFPKGKIVIGHDGRKSSPVLSKALIRGFGRRRTLDGGLMTTPMLYYFAKTLPVAAGVMVTASHNPKQINGLKVVDGDANPLSGLEIKKLLPQ